MASLLLLPPSAAPLGGVRREASLRMCSSPRRRPPLEPLPPELLSELLDDDVQTYGNVTGVGLQELLGRSVSSEGANRLADDVLFEALALELEEEEDMPPDFDVNAQSWLEYNFVADYGFDPLGFASIDLHIGGANDKDRPLSAILRDYREAELRHGRLAMLAALAWPVQELLSPILSRLLREPILVAETGGRSPSVLNGGLEQSSIPFVLTLFAGLVAAIDIASLRRREDMGDDWLPGDFGFDPLNLLGGATMDARRDMQEKEINNGRLAMLAVLVFVSEEAITQRPIIEVTPWLFKPLIAYPEVQRFFDAAFAISAFRSHH